MADETRTLAAFAADLTHDQIPADARARGIDILVDQIGCEIGCSHLPWAKQVRDTYRKTGGAPQATVVRYGDRLPVGSAAFINSTFGHSFEYDDINRGHPGTELIPPLMAVAERDGVRGRGFLTAFLAAYEIAGRVGWSVHPDLMEHGGPHYTTTCAPFGAAAGVARLLGLDAQGICNAMGIAGSYCGGLMQYDHGGGSVKRVICAIAGSSGLQAAHLAQGGITGPEGILEGARGLLKIFSSTYRPAQLVADLGKKWMTERGRFKPYSCCGGIHAAIDGLRNLVTANNLTADGVESIEVGYQTGYHDHLGITSPHDLLGLQFSTSYSLALTMLKGRNTPSEYTLQTLEDPEVRAFASRVQVREDVELTRLYANRLPARVKVRTRSGDVHEKLVIDAKGSTGAPLSSADIDEKFRAQVAGVLGIERCEQLLRALRDIDALDDVAKLLPMTLA